MTWTKSDDQLARDAAGEPPASIAQQGVSIGTVKYWLDDKGHGAVACAELAPWDVWCHFGQIEMTGFRTLVPGQRVEVAWYRTRQESYRFRASRVRPLSELETRASDAAPSAG